MKIVLKSFEAYYFKGLRSLKVEFNEHIQNIMGANETGKSTVMNGCLWCWFGKDSEGRKDYEIKTTDENSVVIPKLDHWVETVLQVGDEEVTVKRTMHEKWVKPRGAAEAEFSGNETLFEWNGVPMREKDYQEKINGIMKEDVFKLLTNPLYFNTGLTGYKIPDWQARRNVLMELAGKIDDSEITAGDTRFSDLLKKLTGKSLEEYKKQVAASKKKIKDTLDLIPARIDEATRAIPEPLDFAAINRQILAKEAEIAAVDQSLTDAAAAQKDRNNQQLGKQNEIFGHKTRMQTIESEIRSLFVQEKNDREAKVRELRSAGRSKENQFSALTSDQTRLLRQKADLEGKILAARTEWSQVDQKQPDARKDDCKCPTCQQQLPQDKIAEKDGIYEKYVADFNANKVRRLTEITKSGQELKAQLEGFTKSLQDGQAALDALDTELTALRDQIAALEAETVTKNNEADQTIAAQIQSHAERKTLQAKVEDITTEILAIQNDGPDNSAFRTQRQLLTADLDALKKQRDTKEQIDRGRARVVELGNEEKELSRQLVELEGIEFVIQEFTRAKIDALESRINHKFKYARFKLFDVQVNGQEVECCETTYKGVVFGTLNTAAKILVGIDIINTLSAHYGVSAPIFLDNRESVTSIPDTDAQIINLIVSPDDKQLRVA